MDTVRSLPTTPPLRSLPLKKPCLQGSTLKRVKSTELIPLLHNRSYGMPHSQQER